MVLGSAGWDSVPVVCQRVTFPASVPAFADSRFDRAGCQRGRCLALVGSVVDSGSDPAVYRRVKTLAQGFGFAAGSDFGPVVFQRAMYPEFALSPMYQSLWPA